MGDSGLSKLATFCVVSLVAVGLGGCTADTSDPAEADAFVFDPGNGGTPLEFAEVSEFTYPSGPYGFDVGDILPDYAFVGYANYAEPIVPGLQISRMSDFYNPTGQELHSEVSAYGPNKPKPLAINLVIGSGWCPPCQNEAATILPPRYDQYAPAGHFVSAMIDGYSTGIPADINALDTWSMAFSPKYTMLIDPKSQLMTHYYPAFPGSLIIDARTMMIMYREVGQPNDAFWTAFEGVIAGTYVIPTE